MAAPTVETLAEQIRGLEALMAERDRRMEERFTSQEQALRVATNALADYKTSANEWRATLNDVRQLTLSRAEYDAKHQALIDKMDARDQAREDLSGRVALLESQARQRVSSLTIWLMGAGVMISLLVGIFGLLRFTVK